MVDPIISTTALSSPLQFESNLSPDALMVYLSTRLNGLDDQIDTIFNAQQAQEKVQTALSKIKTALSTLNENAGKPTDPIDFPTDENDPGGPAPAVTDIEQAIADIKGVDPNLAESIRKNLEDKGFILNLDDNSYNGGEVTATKTYIDGISKDIESQAQMNMIHLQSIMSARQTAIQLSTNLVSALGESTKAIAANIGR